MRTKTYIIESTGQQITVEDNSLLQQNILHELWRVGLPGEKVKEVFTPKSKYHELEKNYCCRVPYPFAALIGSI